MTNEEAMKYLIKPVATSTEIGEEKQKEFEAYNMAKEALQFQDIMINNPKSAKPTPEVCKNCKDNDRPHELTSDDLIIKGAKGIQDGLYNIQNGELFQYKAKGGTVRTYPIMTI